MNYNTTSQWLEGRPFRVLIAIIIGIMFLLVMRLLAVSTGTGGILAVPAFHRFFAIFGGGEMSAFIKLTAYITFAYGLLDLYDKQQRLKWENEGFYSDILPQQDQYILKPADVQAIKLKVIRAEQAGSVLLIHSFIKKAASQFRNDHSIPDTMKALDLQVETTKTAQEGELETTRFIVSTVPMLGFIGTIVELTHSLVLVGEDDYMSKISQSMSSAFDCTLVALLLTIILSFYYHRHIESMDVFFANAKRFIQEHLISRIYRG